MTVRPSSSASSSGAANRNDKRENDINTTMQKVQGVLYGYPFGGLTHSTARRRALHWNGCWIRAAQLPGPRLRPIGEWFSCVSLFIQSRSLQPGRAVTDSLCLSRGKNEFKLESVQGALRSVGKKNDYTLTGCRSQIGRAHV